MNQNLLILAAALALAACANTAAAAEDWDADFGDSVRHMIEAQTFDPKAAAQPSPEAPNSLDGARAEAALKAYRAPRPTTGATQMPMLDLPSGSGASTSQ